jgi:hypothetical protein
MRHLLTFAAFAALAACAVLLASCGGSPEPVSYDKICSQEDGKLVQTVGYFTADSSVFCSNISSTDVRCGLGFVGAPGQKADFTADVAQDTGPNQVEPIPDDFAPEAIVFHAADGGEVHVGEKVSITGKLSVAPNVCFITVDTITKAQ